VAGRDRVIDPVTHDYVPDGKGGWATTETVQTAMYHQITGELDRWWGDPDAGSQLFTFRRAKLTKAALGRAANTLEVSLKALEDEGRIDQKRVTVEQDQVQRLVIASSAHDVQFGEVEISNLQPFGA
jgi:phage gp46-like protein